ncbi:hypothetical protein SC09_contig8orf00218 [Bacillus subtilis]|uniref:Uncharacterized protein n=1 Tax=Bacillus subtilis TaxID=1423 RepID=A0A0D1IX51_BACIU|nr:hypothetical protein SC09_contig8orf00218 [Bacillus subtilis]
MKRIVMMAVGAVVILILLLLYIGQISVANKSEKEKEALQVKYEKLVKEKQENGLTQDETKTFSFIEGVLTTLYEYDNDNYVDRFKKLKGKVSEDILTKISGSSSPQAPKISIKSSVEDIKVYRDISRETGIGALVQIKTKYTVDGRETEPKTYFYRVVVRKNEGNLLMTEFESLGELSPVNET